MTSRCRSDEATDELVGPHHLGEQIPLTSGAPQLQELGQLVLVVDAHCGDLDIERPDHLDDRFDDGFVAGVFGDSADEGTVDQHQVDREMLEMAKRRGASPEVVDGDTHPQVTKPVEDRQGLAGLVGEGAFAEFQAQRGRVELGIGQGVGNARHQGGLGQLDALTG